LLLLYARLPSSFSSPFDLLNRYCQCISAIHAYLSIGLCTYRRRSDLMSQCAIMNAREFADKHWCIPRHVAEHHTESLQVVALFHRHFPIS
jgi:hypothetical protein